MSNVYQEEGKGLIRLTYRLKGDALRQALYDAQALAYKLVISHYLRDIDMPIEAEDERYYQELVDEYNKMTNEIINDDSFTKNLINIVIEVIGKPGDYNKFKKAKKRTTRVYKDIRKMYKNGFYGIKNSELEKELLKLHFAFKESFINFRRCLKYEYYELIPDNIDITLYNGNTVKMSDLYINNTLNNCYVINPELKLAKTDLRLIQLTISKYIFNSINYRRKL